MSTSDNWVQMIGGPKPALMWFADFMGFLCWRQLEFDCLKYVLRKQEDLQNKPFNAKEIEESLRLGLIAIRKLFPEFDGDSEPKARLQSIFEELRDEFKNPILSFANRDDTVLSRLPIDRKDLFVTSFTEFLSSLDYGPKDLRVIDKRGVLNHPRLVRNSSFLWSKIAPSIHSSQARYFVALGIRLRCKSELSADTARGIQLSCNSLNGMIDEKRRRSLQANVKHFPGAILEPAHLVNGLGDLEINPYRTSGKYKQGQQAGLVFTYLMQIGDLRRLEPIRPRASVDASTDRMGGTEFEAFGYKTSSFHLDAEYILSKLFGFPLAQTGIDDLFGRSVLL
jgi:hypothetical protein